MKIEELRAGIEAKRVEIRSFLDAKDVEKATVLMEEKRNLEKALAIEIELEQEELRSLEAQKSIKNKDEKVVNNMEKANEMRAMYKVVMGEETTAEERAIIKSLDTATVIPKQFINEIVLLQKGFGSLKEYCDVKPVTKNEGTIPVFDLDSNTVVDVLEGADIIDGVLATTDLAFKCSKVGLKMPIASEVLEDAEVEIEGLVRDSFANSTTVNHNIKIIKVIKDNATAVATPVDYKAIEVAMDTAVPSVKNGLVVLTNGVGFAHLKGLRNSNGDKLNLVTEIGGKYYFNGKELLVADDSLLAPTVAGKQIFYVLNMKEAVKFLDRRAITIERWRNQGNDTNNISILERFAVVKGSTRSVKSIQF